MNPNRLSTRVGLFVLMSLLLLGALVLSFSKGLSLFHSNYTLVLETANVGGMKVQAAVLLGGLRVGSVSGMSLGADGKTILLQLKIQKGFVIRKDARFSIEQSGFLGDQHVAIYPNTLAAEALADGAIVRCEEPFNLQEAARAATGFIQKVDQTAKKLHDLVDRIDRTVLQETTLTNLSQTLSNFKLLSERTLRIADRVEGVIASNSPPISSTITNLLRFAESMERLGSNVNVTVVENRDDLATALKHVQSASKALSDIAHDLQAGEGMAGSLLKDLELKQAWKETVVNFSVLSSNLSHYGLLFKPKPTKKESSTPSSGRGAAGLTR